MLGEVLVVAEHANGAVSGLTLEVLTKGSEIARRENVPLSLAILGHDARGLAEELAHYGVDEVLLMDNEAFRFYAPDSYREAIRDILKVRRIGLLLMSHSAFGMDFAPRVAVEMGCPIVTDCIDLAISDGNLMATRKIYNGKIVADIEVSGPTPYIATLRPAIFKPKERTNSRSKVTELHAPSDCHPRARRVLGYEKPETGDIDIAQADIVVSVGRGIKEEKNLKVIEELADILGGVVGASRPIVDKGWLPWSRQVGASGKTVRPKLYVACGISGATQHISGMRGSELIVAVNSDPTAPIFDIAHYGVVGDLLKIVPQVIKELRGM